MGLRKAEWSNKDCSLEQTLQPLPDWRLEFATVEGDVELAAVEAFVGGEDTPDAQGRIELE